MAILPYGEAALESGNSYYRYTDTDAFLTLESTEYDPPEGYDAVFHMESEILHTLCVVRIGEAHFQARWWPLDNVDPDWVETHGLEMHSELVVRRIFPGLKPWGFGKPVPSSS